MTTELGSVVVTVKINDKEFTQGLNKSEQRASAFSKTVTGFFERIGQRAFDGLVSSIETGVRGAIGAISEAVNSASDLNESINKTAVVFGQSANAILEWSKTTDDALGQSQRGALEAAASFGNLFTSLGVGRSEAAGMSRELVELASDIASLNNIDPAEALEKLRAGLVGETEPLRTVGVFLNEAAVQAKAAQLGFGEMGTTLTEQDKVLARYALILDQTKNAQGDFARTSNDAANASRRASAVFQNLSSTLGQAFLPLKTLALNSLIDIAQAVEPYANRIVANIANGLAAGIRFITPALMQLRQLFVFWLKPGSPPRLLPELVRWGAAAASEFINGWSKADFDGLDKLGGAIEGILRSFVSSGKLGETDLVSRVLGTRDSIKSAIDEFRQFGAVSSDTINRIARNAGPAGDAVADLVRTYFDLARASERVRQAQDEVNRITREYSAIIDPLQGQIDEVQRAQNRLRDQRRQVELQNVLANFESTRAEKEAARLELQEIALQQQLDNAEAQKDAALDVAQTELDAAEEEQKAAQEKFDIAEAELSSQVKVNSLIGEEIQLRQRLAEEAKRQAEEQARAAEVLRQAILQYQLGLADTTGKIALLRGELAKTPEGTAEYFQILGQISALETQQAEESKRNAEQLADAQLDYQLALADTAGKIEILRGELAKVPADSVEAFRILTQIAQLQQQLSKSGPAGAGLLPEIAPLEPVELQDLFDPEIEEGVKNLKDSIQGIFDLFESGGTRVNPLTGMIESSGSGGALDTWAKKFTETISGVLTSFRDLAATVDELSGKTTNLAIPQTFVDALANIASTLRAINALLEGRVGDFFGESFSLTGGGLLGLLNTAEPGSEEEKSGQAIIDNIGKGLDWIPFWNLFELGLQKVRDMLPGSEPKDTNSPLFDLAASGKAIIDNLLAGIGLKWTELTTDWSTKLQGFVDTITTFLTPIYDTAAGWIQSGWDGIEAKWGEVAEWWNTTLQSFVDKVNEFLTPIYDIAFGWLQSFWDGAKAKWDEVALWWNGPEGVLTSFTAAIEGLATELYDAGAALLDNLWDGLKDKWTEVSDWWSGPQGVWTGFRNTLPFSEPKDPSSPLRGLSKSGEAILGQIQMGMDRASLDASGALGNLRAQFDGAAGVGAATTNNNLGGINVTINVPPGADTGAVRTAAAGGLLDALRAAGIA